jgi:hypothetical protein
MSSQNVNDVKADSTAEVGVVEIQIAMPTPLTDVLSTPLTDAEAEILGSRIRPVSMAVNGRSMADVVPNDTFLETFTLPSGGSVVLSLPLAHVCDE